MKKVILLVAAICLALAGTAFATVVGTPHDLSDDSISGTSQVCVFCHHPHVGSTAQGTELIWNLDSFSTTTFAVYDSSTFTATTAASVDSTAPQSYLCMACHDGFIGANQMIAAAGDSDDDITASLTITNAANLGTSLVDDHPVNFRYDDALAALDGGLESPGSDGDVDGASTATYPLFGDDMMQCATCHNVHAGGTSGDTSADTNIQFMRGDTAASAICVDCHTDK